jgi:hypothetical protein
MIKMGDFLAKWGRFCSNKSLKLSNTVMYNFICLLKLLKLLLKYGRLKLRVHATPYSVSIVCCFLGPILLPISACRRCNDWALYCKVALN